MFLREKKKYLNRNENCELITKKFSLNRLNKRKKLELSIAIFAICLLGIFLIPTLLIKVNLKIISKELYNINYFDVYRDDSLIEVAFNDDSKIVIGSNYYTEGLGSTSHKDNEGFVYYKQIDGEIESATYGEFLGSLLSKDKTIMNSKGKVILFSNENLIRNSSKVSLSINDKSSEINLKEVSSSRCSIRTGKISDGYLVEVHNKIYDKFKEGDLLYIDKVGNTHFGYISDYPYYFELSRESIQIIVSSDSDLEKIISNIERFFMEIK